MTDAIHPFRWNIAAPSELGQLGATDEAALAEALLASLPSRGRTGYIAGSDPLRWFEGQIAACCARIIARSRDADLYFVGRSPESFFDYMQGLFALTGRRNRQNLLKFSGRHQYGENDSVVVHAATISAYRHYLTAIGLHPEHILSRPHLTALVDIVASGHTLGNLLAILYNWSLQGGSDWPAIRHKIVVVGLTEREQSSPKTWRWQQHAAWVTMLPPRAISNIAIAPALFHYLGAAQPKMTASFSHTKWGDATVMRPDHAPHTLAALQIESWLYRRGRLRSSRINFARALSRQPEVKQPWLRSLIGALKR